MNTLLNACICVGVLLLAIQMAESVYPMRVVCYHTNWSQYRPLPAKFVPGDIDPFLCTHIIYSFAKLNEKNEIGPFEANDETEMFAPMVNLKNENPDLKIMLAIGGWSMGSVGMSRMVHNDWVRINFANTTTAYLKKWGFDGLDIDWEYPTDRGGASDDAVFFTRLVQDLRHFFGSELLLSASVSCGKPIIDAAYQVPQLLAPYTGLDFINTMAYDFHGSWDTAISHPAPLYPNPSDWGKQRDLNVDTCTQYYIQKGAPREKINVGMTTYGKSFTAGSEARNNMGEAVAGPGSAQPFTKEAGFVAYYETCHNTALGYQNFWNSDGQCAFQKKGNQWIGYESMQSAKLKAQYAKKQKVGGVAIWALDLDDFTGMFCGQDTFPLINAVKAELELAPEPEVVPASAVYSSNEFPCLASGTFLPVPGTNCRQYHQCLSAGYRGVPKDCPDNLYFHNLKKQCDWNYNLKSFETCE